MTSEPGTSEPGATEPGNTEPLPDAALDLTPRQADAETLSEIYRQGVDTAGATPGVREYFRDTIIYGLSRFFDWLSDLSGLVSWLSWDLVQWVLVGVLLALLAVLVFLLVRRLLANRRQRSDGDGRVRAEAPRRPVHASRDWAEELRLRLEEGDVAGALEALWWWLATGVGVPDADPAWTSRELLAAAGRLDLRRPVRRLDHMIYGPEPPRIDQVREFWHSLRPEIDARATSESSS